MGLLGSLLSCLLWLQVFSAPYSSNWDSFTRYVRDYNKEYINDTTQLVKRFQIFQQSLLRHEKLNAFEAKNGGHAIYGVNKFSDLTQEEFRATHLSAPRYVQSSVNILNTQPHTVTTSFSDYPKKFDWRDKGVISGIRNQKRCGSCWAFSVVESLESRLAIQTGQPVNEFSVQQLISCDYNPSISLYGCQGGVLFNAFSSIKDKMTIVPSSIYPFASSDGQTKSCQQNLPNKGVLLHSFMTNTSLNEDIMVQYIYDITPTSNSANAAMWQDYSSGIIQHHCNDKSLDHAIQVIGYDFITGPIPYWIVRNTWGNDWGENGYLRLKFGENICGIVDEVVTVTDVSAVNM